MEIQNLKTVEIGSGKHTFNSYLTLDLIPFHLVIKYNKIKSNLDLGWGKSVIYENPPFIDKFYTIEIYQSLIDFLCENFNLEKRKLISFRRNQKLPLFDFKTDKYIYEFQYTNAFSMDFYTETKVQNALKSYEQLLKLHNGFEGKHTEDFYRIYYQIKKVIDSIKDQKVFTNRDYYKISNSTLNNFIHNFNQRAKNK
jgi:hypothetical protein